MSKPSAWTYLLGSVALAAALFYGSTFLRSSSPSRRTPSPPASSEITGTVTRDGVYFIPGFGHYYRIELVHDDGKMRPYVFVGEEAELRTLDRDVNIGDHIAVQDKGAVYSLDLERVLLPQWITRVTH